MRSISPKAEREPSPGPLSPQDLRHHLTTIRFGNALQNLPVTWNHQLSLHLRSEVKAISHTVDSPYQTERDVSPPPLKQPWDFLGFFFFFFPSQQPSTCDEASRPPRCKACYHNPSQNKTERFPQRTRGQRTSIKGTVLTMRRSKTSSHVGLSESSFTAGLRNPVELSKVLGKLTVSGFWHVCQSVWVDFNLSLSQFHNLLLCSEGERTSLCARGDF